MRLTVKLTHMVGAAALLFASAAPLHAIGEGWIMDFEKAKAQAAEENKHILMDFTGSDWCGWCIRLNEEVFSQDVFKEEAPKHFVLLALDYPRDTSHLTEEIQAQNARLQQEYAIRGYPTIILADAEGTPYAQTGYRDFGAEGYVDHLKEFKNNHAETEALIKKVREAKATDDEEEAMSDTDKAKTLDEALEKVQSWEIIQKRYASEIDQIIALDADNALGLKSKYAQKKAVGEVEALLQSRQFAEALPKIEAALEAQDTGAGQLVQKLLFYKGQCLFYLENREGMVEALNQALEAAPEGQYAAQIKANLERFAAEANAEKDDAGSGS